MKRSSFWASFPFLGLLSRKVQRKTPWISLSLQIENSRGAIKVPRQIWKADPAVSPVAVVPERCRPSFATARECQTDRGHPSVVVVGPQLGQRQPLSGEAIEWPFEAKEPVGEGTATGPNGETDWVEANGLLAAKRTAEVTGQRASSVVEGTR